MRFTADTATIVALLLTSTRTLAWAVIAPPFATAGIPRSVKPMIAVALSLAVVPMAAAHAPAAQAAPLMTAVVLNAFVGAALGFGTRLIFAAIESAGSLLDLFGGFSLAFALDPLSQNDNSVIGRLYGLLATTLIFVSGAYQLILGGFLRTFRSVPIDSGISLRDLDRTLISATTSMFVAALQIAGPLMVVLFLADMAVGLLARIAPQLNVFSLSFPLKIVLTLALLGFGLLLLPNTVARLAEQVVLFVGAARSG